MRTAGGVNGYFALTEGTLFFCFFFHFLFFVPMLELIDLTDQQENDKADNEEVDNLCQESTIVDGGGIFTASEDDYQIIKLILPVKILSNGIKMSFTREPTIPVKALPIIIPTARSIIFPFNANVLNSPQNFFMPVFTPIL